MYVYNGPWVAVVDRNGRPIVLETGDTIEFTDADNMRLYGYPVVSLTVVKSGKVRRFFRRLVLRTLRL